MVAMTSYSSTQLARLPDSTEDSAQEPVDTDKSIKMKLCLYLESLFASMEVGMPM
jgi:hypothetical protein